LFVNYTLETIPNNGETFLKSTANLSTGGTSVDVTEMTILKIFFLAERISRVIGLDVCGLISWPKEFNNL
jgi:cyanophycin synthetase